METISKAISEFVMMSRQCSLGLPKLSGSRYKLPVLSASDVYSLLECSYKEVVESRGREMIMPFPKTEAAQVAQWAVDKTSKQSLILFGQVGNGKTTLAMALYYTYRRIHQTALKLDGMKQTEEQHRLAQELMNFCPSINYQKATAIKDILTDDILIIDDFGQEPTAKKDFGTDIMPICDNIMARYDSRKPLILTTNLDTEGILHKYGKRVQDRLKETAQLVFFKGKSFR